MIQLSKSEFMLYLKHPAWLWLKKHDKDKLPEPDENLQALFDAGNEFEKYAEKRFPGGVSLGFDNYADYLSLPERTKRTLDNNAKTVFQGRFEDGPLTCICDIIERAGTENLDLYEVKSSTTAKRDHEIDLAFQVLVLESAGYRVRKISVIHINNRYVRNGEIDYEKFTKVNEITKEVRSGLDAVKRRVEKALQVIASPKCPDISPRHCQAVALNEWLSIYKELANTTGDHTIYDLCSPAKHIGKLEDLGIKVIKDIPEHFALTPRQQRQVSAVKRDERVINGQKIGKFLGSLSHPLYFLDYETAGGAIPYYNGTRPYQQIPFQYSLHIVETPGAEAEHREYLHREKSNPVPRLASKLKDDIGEGGSVIVWNKSFEMGCNTDMGRMFPEFRDFFEDVNNRVADLMDPFFKGWFVDKNFYGSASLKYVLPTMVPWLSYDDLEIQEGASAQRLWMDHVLKDKIGVNGDELFRALTEYCKLDTQAMVEIFRLLSSTAETPG